MDLMTWIYAKHRFGGQQASGGTDTGVAAILFDGDTNLKPRFLDLIRVSEVRVDVSKIRKILFASQFDSGQVDETVLPFSSFLVLDEGGLQGLIEPSTGAPFLGYAEEENAYGVKSGFYVYCKDRTEGDHTTRDFLSAVVFET